MMMPWSGIYKVVEAMVPLYFSLFLGYGSVRWWRIFTPEQCTAVNRLVAFFTLPFFTFEFAVHVDPFDMNFRLIAADAVSKLLIVANVSLWAKFAGGDKGRYCWSITTFSLCTLTNSLVVGVPLLDAMYGRWSEELVVQLSVVQAIVWLTMLLFVMELQRASGGDAAVTTARGDGGSIASDGKMEEGRMEEVVDGTGKQSFWALMRVVWLKLALNPNSYASIVGITWAFLANRWHFEMPSIMEGSVLIISKAGTGMAMFSMGLFMAQQEKFVACGPALTVFGLVLRFIAGPASMAISSMIMGLQGDILKVAITQAALPQSITSFIFAREYGLHADVLSTAVIFGMLISLPVLVVYYIILGFMS